MFWKIVVNGSEMCVLRLDYIIANEFSGRMNTFLFNGFKIRN